MDCGNTDKFIGKVNEKGLAYIYQTLNDNKKSGELSWIYILSNDRWRANSKPEKCYYCGSKNIRRLKAS